MGGIFAGLVVVFFSVGVFATPGMPKKIQLQLDPIKTTVITLDEINIFGFVLDSNLSSKNTCTFIYNSEKPVLLHTEGGLEYKLSPLLHTKADSRRCPTYPDGPMELLFMMGEGAWSFTLELTPFILLRNHDFITVRYRLIESIKTSTVGIILERY